MNIYLDQLIQEGNLEQKDILNIVLGNKVTFTDNPDNDLYKIGSIVTYKLLCHDENIKGYWITSTFKLTEIEYDYVVKYLSTHQLIQEDRLQDVGSLVIEKRISWMNGISVEEDFIRRHFLSRDTELLYDPTKYMGLIERIIKIE
jgi:hypothetical protein